MSKKKACTASKENIQKKDFTSYEVNNRNDFIDTDRRQKKIHYEALMRVKKKKKKSLNCTRYMQYVYVEYYTTKIKAK